MAATMSREAGLIPGGLRGAAAPACSSARACPPKRATCAPDTVLEHMRIDKKVKSGRIRLVLLQSIGASFVTADYPDAALRRTLEAHLG